MKGINRLLFVAVVVVATSNVPGTAAMHQPWPTQPPCGQCASISVQWKFEKRIDSHFGNPEEFLRRLEISDITKYQLKPASVSVAILSRDGRTLFRTQKASAQFVDTMVVVEMDEQTAKAAARYYKSGNKLRITIKAVPAIAVPNKAD